MARILISENGNRIELTSEDPHLIKLLEEILPYLNVLASRGIIKIDGTVFTFGKNDYWQSGTDASQYMIDTPTNISSDSNFCKISTSTNHSVAIDLNGKCWAWGMGDNGQLGNNSTTRYSTPIAVCGSHTFCDICAGGSFSTNLNGHTLSIDNHGQSWGWGYGYYGVHGNNDQNQYNTPVAVCGNHTFCKISIGEKHSLAIDNAGKGWGWGFAYYGYLGNNDSSNHQSTPVAIYGNYTFCKISAGFDHSLGINHQGKLYSWGSCGNGQLGINLQFIFRITPVAVCGNHTFCSISTGVGASLSIDKNGQAWSWGRGNYGQLGNNSITNALIPVAVCGNHIFCEITSGPYHCIAVDDDHKIWAWGHYSQIGIKVPSKPMLAEGDYTFCQIAAGARYSTCIDYNGNIWSWGNNQYGQHGNNSVVSNVTPTLLNITKTFCHISAGDYHTLSIDSNGVAWGWGLNLDGQLGNTGLLDTEITPVAVHGNHTFCKISGGRNHSLAVDNNNLSWCWGLNTYGQIGDSTTDPQITPVSVHGNHTFCKVSTGTYFNIAIDENGQAWAWGQNQSGKLGDNSITNRYMPVAVCGNHTFCEISIGGSHSLGLDNNGKVWTWGLGNNGRLGNNSTLSRRTPTAIYGSKTFCDIAAMGSHSAGIDNRGQIWTWGFNGDNRLGNNSIIDKCTPIAVCGNHTFCVINTGSGSYHSTAIDNHGKVWSWGLGGNGQLGVTLYILTPIAICV